jgi:cobalt/nickel transport system permease protein
VRFHLLDHAPHRSSPVHRLPTGIKLAGALAAILAVVLTPFGRAWPLGAVAVLLLIAAGLSRTPPAFLARRILLLEPFVLGVAALSLFQPHGGVVFLTVLTRSTICLFAMVLLTAVTPFSDLLRFMRKVRVPALLVTVIALMVRYLFVLVNEADRLRRARASRTFSRSRRQAWRSLASVTAQLFVRSSERGERVYAAMRARGW